MQKNVDQPRLFPWYVHIIGGWSIGAIFPWYLTCKQFYYKKQKRTVWMLMGGLILLYGLFSYASLTAPLPWDKLLAGFLAVNIILSLCAWAAQRKYFGAAPKRYFIHEWKNWIAPILIAVIFGVGYAVTISLFPLIGDRLELYQARDLLAKKVILWDFFHNVPYSLIFSIPIGIWWAGERDRFTIANVLSYILGIILFSLILSSMASLFYFILSGGQLSVNQTSWQVLSNDLSVFKKILVFLETQDYSTYFLVPLLLGTVVKTGDFFKRTLTVFPLLTVIFLFLSFYSPEFWQYYQNQIYYDMSSEDPQQREKSHNRAVVMLNRFPEHEGWPEIAITLAGYYYQEKEYETAEKLYRKIAKRTQNSPQWYRQAAIAEAALASPDFANENSISMLTVPPLRYESYMTNNWMALLRNMRYYEGNQISETDTLIKLKEISEKDEKIDLSPMPTLAELDSNATSLGYSVLIVPSELSTIKELLHAGYPVIQPIKHSFSLLSGIDESRSLITGATYEHILYFLKESDKEGIPDDSFLSEEENSFDAGTKTRIDLLAYTEIPFSFWQHPRQKDHGALMAVVFPPEELEKIGTLLGGNKEALLQQSKARLLALIGLNAVKCGDIVGAVNWAERSYALQNEPFPLHVAHLATLLWQSRDKRIESRLQLEKHLPALTSIDLFLNEEPRRSFLRRAKEQFYDDLENNRINWMIRQQCKDFLDRSDPRERQRLIALSKMNVQSEPDSRADWLFLTGLYEWEKNKDEMISGYRNALAAAPWDNEIALKLAYLYIQKEHYDNAQKLIKKLKPKTIRYQPDYYYCLASIAQWKNDHEKAGKYYEKAIKMRRYDRNYHLGYAKLLEKTGENMKKAEQLRSWVARLDGSLSINLDN